MQNYCRWLAKRGTMNRLTGAGGDGGTLLAWRFRPNLLHDQPFRFTRIAVDRQIIAAEVLSRAAFGYNDGFIITACLVRQTA